ncbi:MAG: hypothetical protein LUP97_05755 [Methanoregula sp.]|nr:hypothetical protein [Methanoregula sp.]
MGDTLTHLPDGGAVRELCRNAFAELVPGGKPLLSFRDYMTEPAGAITVIPVRREPGRIFLCRLEYGESDVCVSDILYSTAGGRTKER